MAVHGRVGELGARDGGGERDVGGDERGGEGRIPEEGCRTVEMKRR